MSHRIKVSWLVAAMAVAAVSPALAQSPDGAAKTGTKSADAVRPAAAAPAPVFEEPKELDWEIAGVKIGLGGAFTQTFQSLSHENTAAAVVRADGTNTNALADIGAGFNLASANLNLTAQLTPGLKVVLETYLSSRHHYETWVKGGYLQIDESPLAIAPLEKVMEYVTVKAGHYEVNYGDAHFRRSDNGNGINNPFAENLILDAFTTEIGGEAIVRKGPLMAVLGVTNGQNKGDITYPEGRSWAFVSKIGVDQSFGEDVRLRLTGSSYQNDNAGRATLYGGDRAGSAYWGVMDNAAAKSFTNGRLNPNFTEEISAYQVNPFVKLGDLELFGVMEWAEGRTLPEQKAGTDIRQVTQYSVDAVYRLLDDRLYVGGRYNTVSGELFAVGSEQSSDRSVLGAGWFITPNVLLRGEYVKQTFDGFAATHILNGGEFKGVVVQGVVAF